ncbi:MAG: hypothetical protein JWP35_1109 [Caulobacter sp.]|nr:hypothetical protein [Caulobacter sp.]
MKHQGAIAGAVLVASCCMAPAAWAQASGGGNDAQPAQVDEVIVTALKQGASALNTSASVTVVSSQQLEAANVTSAQQLSGLVPGYFSMQGTAGTSASFRGLGSNASDPSIESSVGTFIDGIYLGHVRDYTTPLYDTQQIEFIAGTQSTLLGKNTSLGAVSITNRRPGHVFGYDVSANYTSAINGYRFQGAVDLPLGDSFAARLAMLANREDGFVENAFLGRPERQIRELSGRITVDGDLGGRGRLTFIYQHDKRDTRGQFLEVFTDPNGAIAGAAAAFGQTTFDTTPNDVTYSGSDRLNPADPPVPLPFDNQTGDRATLIATFDLGAGTTLTSQTAYVGWNSQRVTDLDFTSVHLIDLVDGEKNKVFSQELRLSSPQGEKFSYIAGLFYYRNDYTLNRGITSDLGLTLDSLLKVKTSSWAEFASARYDLTDQFTLLAGVRGTQEDKTPTYEISGVLGTPTPLTTLPTAKSNEVDGNVGVEFHPRSGTMLYATWARGSKSGGFQANPDSLAVAHYDGEVAYTTEVGAKFNFGGRGFLTLAVFDTKVDGFQTSRLAVIPPSVLPQNIITNADVRSTGAEASGGWNVTANFKLTGDVTYADSKFTNDVLNEVAPGVFQVEIYKGMVLPRAPLWAGQVGASYRAELGDNLQFRAQGTVRYASVADLQLRSEHPLSPKADAHTTVDAQFSIGSETAGWEVSLIGNNLTDDRYDTFTSESFLDGDAFYGTRSRPRTIALQLRLRH